MTCREKLATEFPERVNPKYTGGCNTCPHIAGYLNKPDYCEDENIPSDVRCTMCWNREIPGTLPMQYPIDMAAKAELANEPAPQWTKENTTLSDTAKKAIEEHRAHILDSGNRTEFDTGAVRDMREGKGRCDLMPLEVAAKLMNRDLSDPDLVIGSIALFKNNGYHNTVHLYNTLMYFSDRYYGCFSEMFLEAAKHFEEGAKKYGENNWQKGIPVYCYIDSAVRHYFKWVRGDRDEPHDRAFVWNLMCCIWEVDFREEATMSKDRATLSSVCPVCNREWTRKLTITEKELETIRKSDSSLLHFMGRAICSDCKAVRNRILNARITTYTEG